MRYEVSNFKVSIKSSCLSLDNVSAVIERQGRTVKNFYNFITFEYIYSFIVFKQNKFKENHINITKIRTRDEIASALLLLEQIIGKRVDNITVDNIIATSEAKTSLDLHELALKDFKAKTKYNSEKFPGLFVKYPYGTAILFHSGKLVLVGCKSEKKIECLLQEIAAIIELK